MALSARCSQQGLQPPVIFSTFRSTTTNHGMMAERLRVPAGGRDHTATLHFSLVSPKAVR